MRNHKIFCLGLVISMESGSHRSASLSGFLCGVSSWLPDPPSQTQGTFLCSVFLIWWRRGSRTGGTHNCSQPFRSSSSSPLSDWLPVTLITAVQARARHAGSLDPILSGALTPSSPDMFSPSMFDNLDEPTTFCKKLKIRRVELTVGSNIVLSVGTAVNIFIMSYSPVHVKDGDVFWPVAVLVRSGGRSSSGLLARLDQQSGRESGSRRNSTVGEQPLERTNHNIGQWRHCVKYKCFVSWHHLY